MGLSQLESSPMRQLAVDEAFTTPFLMDELLALSAAHKSTLPSTQHRDFYRTEATRLQTRALAQFNMAEADVSDDNCVAVFLFSAFVGQHVLFDTFSSHGEQDSLGVLLAKFIQCLSLHRGIAAIAGRSWPKLQARMPPEFGTHGATPPAGDSVGTECAGLVQMLDRSDLGEAEGRACRAAVAILQGMLDPQRAGQGSSRRFIVVQEWPVRLSAEYVSLLSQKRPEALAVLAYYSVLLHRARDHWLVGRAGRFLIQAISEHLGQSWADWLAWPNRVIIGVSHTNTSQLRLSDGSKLSMVDHGWA